ncbi:kinase-like protein [Macrolepiota fuliginosa MF-IS2]|uniref:Kinase-like protein n=1 Tax=Macrolepiota fuliginosa MF-IS2 TaxID=1400762 RepID=A0A9P5XB41_9AGAR|nr:kinase-like protein [Macrolepiota fuliginosa MF-IS2]
MATTRAEANGVFFPKIGTIIDGGRLQLLSIIGEGGYGVVYQAIDVHNTHCSYAVKCLIRTPEQHQSHTREIFLHRLVSSHPGVVTLHRFIEEDEYLYLVMEYASDQDLFIQILDKCRYLGNNILIKNAFLQLLDATEHCHSLGIYHRDLKPENFLCFDNGLRMVLTDFGLATTEEMSGEFRTGSVFHMSPECQRDGPNRGEGYSPEFCDIWSLGILLLNLVTGRNPWGRASRQDPAFYRYHYNPHHYLPTVLPISSELNDVLTMILRMDWRKRPSIPQIRVAIMRVSSFYAKHTVFEGNLAKCGWEVGRDLGPGTQKPDVRVHLPPILEARSDTQSNRPKMIIKGHIRPRSSRKRVNPQEDGDDDGADNQISPNPPPGLQSDTSSCTSDLSCSPITPNSVNLSFDQRLASGPKYKCSINSLLCGLQSFLRLCSSSSLPRRDNGRLTPDPDMFTLDI